MAGDVAGSIHSFSTHSYLVNQVPHTMTVDQTITYTECDAAPLDDLVTQTVEVSRTFVVYDSTEQISRYATTNAVSLKSGRALHPAFD